MELVVSQAYDFIVSVLENSVMRTAKCCLLLISLIFILKCLSKSSLIVLDKVD